MKPKSRKYFFDRLAIENPNPTSDLEWINTFTLLVAVVLSAQATDVSVNKVTKTLFKTVTTPEKMLVLGENSLRNRIKTIGLFNSKAKNIIKLSKLLIKLHGSVVPNDQSALEALPGVGRKTANVIRNVAFNEPTIAVDTHIFRVSNRTGLARGKTPIAVEKELQKVTPDKFKLHAHNWLILHGRYICKARRPLCDKCLVEDLCSFKGKTII